MVARVAEQSMHIMDHAQERVKLAGNQALIQKLQEEVIQLKKERDRAVADYEEIGAAYTAVLLENKQMKEVRQTLRSTESNLRVSERQTSTQNVLDDIMIGLEPC